jgi:hypothetical protein
MHNGLKLLTGLAATVVLAKGALITGGYTVVGRLSWAGKEALLAAGVADGSISLRQPGRPTGRVMYVSGTANAATRAAVLARVRNHPGIHDAHWVQP